MHRGALQATVQGFAESDTTDLMRIMGRFTKLWIWVCLIIHDAHHLSRALECPCIRKKESEVAQSYPTLRPRGLQPAPGSSVHGIF